MSGAMPTPLSRTRTITSRRAGAASSKLATPVTPISPSRSVYFTALFSKLANICSSRVASPRSRTGSDGIETEIRCPRSSAVERLQPELDSPLGQPRGIEQIVDHAHHVRDLPVDEVPRAVVHG